MSLWKNLLGRIIGGERYHYLLRSPAGDVVAKDAQGGDLAVNLGVGDWAQIATRMYLNTAKQPIASGVLTLVDLGAETNIIGSSWFDPVAHTWTPQAGTFLFFFAAQFELMADGNLLRVDLRKNGSTIFSTSQRIGSGGTQQVSASFLDAANGSDVYSLYAYHNNAISRYITNTPDKTFLYAMRIL